MDVLNLEFLKNASGAGYGPSFRNDRFSVAVVQVEGTFAALSMSLEGRVADGGEWEIISGWNVSSPNAKVSSVSATGIYEFPIEGIVEFRFRVLSVEGGLVSAVGVLYDAADGTVYPYAPASSVVTFGNPKLFVKGTVEQIFFDPSTGNIVGFDKAATEGAVSITANLSEITGGIGNRLIGVLPDTARVSGTYTSAAFSLATREKIMGGEVAYNAVVPVCETVTEDSTHLIVAGHPAPGPGESERDEFYWCYVQKSGESANGKNVSVDPLTGVVQDYVPEEGGTYAVTYYAHNVSAQTLPVPTLWNPVVMMVQEKFGVYEAQNGSAERGILRGWLTFIVPRAILNADAGVNASQTANADTAGNWIALPGNPENMPLCDCGEVNHPLAYYVYLPCAGENDAVSDIVSVGSGLTLKAGRSAQLPVKLVMPDDSLIQPDYSTLGYYSEDDGIATVDNGGIVTAVSEGETVVCAYVYKSDGSVLECRTVVAVEGVPSALSSHPDHILME